MGGDGDGTRRRRLWSAMATRWAAATVERDGDTIGSGNCGAGWRRDWRWATGVAGGDDGTGERSAAATGLESGR
ncbi:unnamed protein product [Linum trigynum]|uniref:Uncharacterized protein n=1 Tax=Linum trigynum TaxID=586398 RepID=A0AAV2FCK9_9ROSI